MNKVLKFFLISFLCLALLFLSICAYFFVCYPVKFTYEVEYYSQKFNLNPNLVYSTIRAESSFNPLAVSKSGAMGLMQLMPTTAVWIAGELKENFEIENLNSPETNIKYGCFYLRYLLNKFKNETYALCAYNAGETVVRGWINSQEEFTILYPETASYVKKVNRSKKVYKVLNNLSIKI